MIEKTSSNQSRGRDRECKMVRFKVPQYNTIYIVHVWEIFVVNALKFDQVWSVG